MSTQMSSMTIGDGRSGPGTAPKPRGPGGYGSQEQLPPPPPDMMNQQYGQQPGHPGKHL